MGIGIMELLVIGGVLMVVVGIPLTVLIVVLTLSRKAKDTNR